MFAIIGIVVVFGCIVAGYLMEHGNLRVLMQPAELIIIGGIGRRNRPDCQSIKHSQGHRPRNSRGICIFAILHSTLCGLAQDAL